MRLPSSRDAPENAALIPRVTESAVTPRTASKDSADARGGAGATAVAAAGAALGVARPRVNTMIPAISAAATSPPTTIACVLFIRDAPSGGCGSASAWPLYVICALRRGSDTLDV